MIVCTRSYELLRLRLLPLNTPLIWEILSHYGVQGWMQAAILWITKRRAAMVDWPEIVKGGISAGWGLVGVIVGSWLTARHQQIERRNARRREQLMEFYAPMRGMRTDIKAKSDVRVRIQSIAGAEWQQQFSGVDDPEAKKRIDDGAWPKYEKLNKYSDDQLRTDIIPTYRKMVEHFMSHMGYAEESTIAHYSAFVEFVEIWNRFLSESLPSEVAVRLSQAESKLYPLYDDIEMNAKRLSEEMKNEPSLRRKLIGQLKRKEKGEKAPR
jgi:hypothetical protein